MSLTVRQLNADSTFLLTFQPAFAPKDSKGTFPGSFTILIDPWLTGSSTVFHSSFAHSTHSQPTAIKSLRELKEKIDVIIISQDKPDHCSRDTLCSLPRDYKGRILATPKAAKKIREWDHFDNSYMIQDLPHYNAAKPETITRIRIAPYSSGSADGEVTIANIGSKVDLTRLHNAIGITYCPPGTVLTTTDGNTIKLTDLPMTSRLKASSPPSPTSRRQRPSISSPNGIIKGVSNALPQLKRSASNTGMSRNPIDDEIERNRRPSTSGSRRPNISTLSARQPNFENVLSVLYTPHSVDKALLRPYINNHLALLPNALPITTLFHALNTESNPKLLGGLVSAGAPGGVGIVKEVDVKYWIAAHDEVKENSGWATKFIRSKRYEVEEVVRMLRAIDGISGTKGKRTIVEVLETGGRKVMK